MANAELDHRQIKVVIFALSGALLLAALDQTIVSTALPEIVNDLSGLDKLSWVATAYLLTGAVVTPLYGKLGDMYGRKKLFMIAILLFLFGSVLCGFSQNMGQLIASRAVQGLGGGGIFTLVFSIIGDIVPPRQRGRYQGYFGAVFGLASIIGPLLGGILSDQLSWRWIFFVNLPLGAVALLAIWHKLKLPVQRTRHQVDFAGAGLLAVAAVCLLLGLVWGGTVQPWASPVIIGLFTGSLLATFLFIKREQRAVEPIIPLRLFNSSIFRVSILLSTLSGLIMFGAIIFLPVYQQIVRGDSATRSGLLLIPLVFGLLLGSVLSGRLISKYGHYRPFPIVGTALVTVGLYLFSNLTATTSQAILTIWMLVLGFGIGLFMQVMTLAVQNSVDRKDLGTATSVVIFFRTIGSTLGAAIFGAIFTSRLAYYLQNAPIGSPNVTDTSALATDPNLINSLAPDLQPAVIDAFARSFHDIFIYALPFAIAAFVVSLYLKEVPLRETTHETPSEPKVQRPT